jgi:hypothetical protein
MGVQKEVKGQIGSGGIDPFLHLLFARRLLREELDFYRKLRMRFVIPGCHVSLSFLVVTPPCHFDRRAGN